MEVASNKKYLVCVAGIAGACALSFILLGLNDGLTFLKWAAFMIIIGMLESLIVGILFDGYMPVDKILGIVIPGFLTWVAGIVFHIPFTGVTCLAAIIIPYVVVSIMLGKKKQLSTLKIKPHIKYEAIFFFMFLLWTYLIGFNPSAYGTERFMDYGFIQKMIVSTKLPPEDIWYSGNNINYYYGGQFFAAFLAKLTNTKAEYAYNLVRAVVPALLFTGVFGLVEQMILDKSGDKKSANIFAALSASVTVFAGNGHYLVYGLFKPLLSIKENNYWFPDSTRYIGYNPLVPNDQTIHEFPCYSFILGDLHAHMLNVILVILIISLLYSFLKNKEKRYLKLFFIGLVWGLCNWTNYWDFIIYIVVIGITVIAANIISFVETKDILKNIFLQMLTVIITGVVAALPFTLNFKSVFKGVGIAQYHTKPYQLIILWGIPIFLSFLFFFLLLKDKKKIREKDFGDWFCFILSGCAIGLVIIPELVYVRDIYESTHARANTMFKLTYQSFIMFGICSGYIISMLLKEKGKILRITGLVMTVVHILLLGYFFHSSNNWFTGYCNPTLRKGIYALDYLDTMEFDREKPALLWLKEKTEKEEIKGIVAEAPGDSYTAYNRVSVITGLSDVIGWEVHEWLWRDNYETVQNRSLDIDYLYNNPELSKEIIKRYNIKYIFFGQREVEKYGEKAVERVAKLGTVIFGDDGAIILEVNRQYFL